jgi:hypothetical protein
MGPLSEDGNLIRLESKGLLRRNVKCRSKKTLPVNPSLKLCFIDSDRDLPQIRFRREQDFSNTGDFRRTYEQ